MLLDVRFLYGVDVSAAGNLSDPVPVRSAAGGGG
jgi:hypothetical protein